ncbi:MAG TPA: lipase family protein [Woeseiaceae bacterium]|nr:lipase family protein [Woeseiaceae bacterium]
MKKNRVTGLFGLLATFGIPLLLAAPFPDAFAQTIRPGTSVTTLRRATVEPGANAFASLNRDERGHSLTNSYLLAMVSHYMYPHAYDPNPGDNFVAFRNQAAAKFEHWGMQRTDIRSRSNVQYVVMSDPNVIILGFRGSDAVEHMDGFADWIATDAMALQKKVSTWGTVAFTERNWLGQTVTVRKAPGVHTGITEAYWTVRNDINDLILAHGGRSKKLFITGHSLGAGLAVIAAIDQGYAGRPSSRRFVAQGVYTYGGPRVGNGIFKRLFDSKRSAGGARALNTHRYVNFNDIVAMVPGDTVAHDAIYVPLGHYGPGEPHDNVKYIHVGRTSNIRQNGTIDRDSVEYRGLGDPARHHSSLYAHHIFQANVAGRSWAGRMPPPPTPITGL